MYNMRTLPVKGEKIGGSRVGKLRHPGVLWETLRPDTKSFTESFWSPHQELIVSGYMHTDVWVGLTPPNTYRRYSQIVLWKIYLETKLIYKFPMPFFDVIVSRFMYTDIITDPNITLAYITDPNITLAYNWMELKRNAGSQIA